MSTKHLIDPELIPFLEALPDFTLSVGALPVLRQTSAEMRRIFEPADFGAIREEITVPGLNKGQPDVRCLVYRPASVQAPTGALLHLHGGGYVMGAPEMDDLDNLAFVQALGITIVSVDYRLAPEHAVPAAIEDGYAVLAWMHSQADELGIDADRVAVGGESAGGGVAAGLVQHACAMGDFPICFQLLTYPMIDSRTGTDAQPGDPLTGEFVWDRINNAFGWSVYLGETEAAAPFVPALAETLEGLPPTWIGTATQDLFRDENIAYAQRLLESGVPTDLVVYRGTCHGFPHIRGIDVSRRYSRDRTEALGRALNAGA